MGLFGGILSKTEPIARNQLETLASALQGDSQRRLTTWRCPQVGLVGETLLADSWDEQDQAMDRGSETLIVAADCYLDNRRELIDHFAVSEHHSGSAPLDERLIAAAYHKSGTQCGRELRGDFAFAIWDPSDCSLLLGRDPLGLKQLYFADLKGHLIFSSRIEGVLALLNGAPSVNREFVRDFLADDFECWRTGTIYREVARLEPGYCLRADRGGTHAIAYYQIGEHLGEPPTSEQQAVERFRELFLESVRVRLDGSRKAGILVSGGLDSSSVACAAQRLVEEGLQTECRIYSAIFQQTPRADERGFLQSVGTKCSSLPLTEVLSDDCWGLREFGESPNFPLFEPEIAADRSLLFRLLRRAREDGCSVVLGGFWGDQVLAGGQPYHFPPNIRDVPLSRLRQEMVFFRKYTKTSSLRLLLHGHLVTRLPETVRVWLRWWIGRGNRSPGPFQMHPGDSRKLPAPPPLGSEAARVSHRCLVNGLAAASFCSFERWARSQSIEFRHPFLDLRLIEFLLSLPARLFFQNGTTKYVLREGMRGILSEQVRQRPDWAIFAELLHRGLNEFESSRVASLLSNSRLVAEGFLRQDELSSLWSSYREGSEQFVRPLVRVLCAEEWFQAYERRWGH